MTDKLSNKNLALFDFDGTLTDADMFTKFLKFSATKKRAWLIRLTLLPLYGFYKLGLFPAPTLRKLASFVAYKNKSISFLLPLGEEYALKVIPKHLRKQAIERLNWHLEQGDTVIVVSASLNLYLKPWCHSLGIGLICSELATQNDKFTGLYINGDVSDHTKAERVKSMFSLKEFKRIYAYGDTPEDHALLSLADEQYMNWVRLK
ncbi:HAD-IB family hydrolase [Pseudoalteromonas phenolica]|uniref:HAD-IB family hydrolase n=1 Tax=Pseudoalteromonas phenolica TaxID=161398 RepID=A0A4Q7INZ6_9GAMM|nr:HAD family hydrolase [Pseudoalteromonas phenolica]RZQ53650.1 HAD-IB family hydrolase [Pseudoalteromonas phenolica]